MKGNNQNQTTLFRLASPIFIEIFLMMLMGNADTLMLSQYSDHSVAAVGISNQIVSLLSIMFAFVTTGTMIVISQAIGAKKRQRAVELAVVSIFVNLLFGLIISSFLGIFGKHFLQLMNTPKNLMGDAYPYLIIVGSFLFLQSTRITIGAVIKSYGYTKDSMFVTLGMNILNIIGDATVIFGLFGCPVLGVKGVALTTTLSRLLGLIALVIILFKRMEKPLPFLKLFKLPFSHVRDILKIGIPSAGEQVSFNLSQFTIMYFITLLGTEAITTKVYVQNISMFFFLPSMAIQQGTQILIGRHIGAKEIKDAFHIGAKSWKIALVIALSITVIVALNGHFVLSIFTHNQAIIKLGSELLFINIALEFGRTSNIVVINALRSVGDVQFPFYMGIFSMWLISVTFSYLLGVSLGLGLVGVWIALASDEVFRGIFMVHRWYARKWIKHHIPSFNGT